MLLFNSLNQKLKKMKSKPSYLVYLLIFVSLVTTSCEKFLNDTPQSSLTTGNAYNSASDIENVLAGCYSTFYTDYYQWENVMLSDNRSDNAYPGGGGEETFVDIDLFNIPPSNSHNYNFWWGQPYQGIAKCNILLEKIGSVTDPKLDLNNRRNQIIGEASFLRAFHYYQLVKLFGGVPLELKSNTVDPAVIRKPRATETEVYNQIESDLQVAVTNLPDDFGDPTVSKVRATKGAANALLAKIWAQRSDRDYNKVLQYCNTVIASPAAYALMTSYADLFDGDHYMNSESILEVPYITGSPTSSWGVELFLPAEDPWQKYCVPSKDLVAAYKSAGDAIRLKSNIIFYKNLPWADENWNPCNNSTDSIPANYKQKHAAGFASGDHQYLLRLGDIITLKAEAQNELGDLAGAIVTLNQIRSRVNLPDVTAASKEEMKLKILNERRLELAFEAQRWDDLVRSGEATNVMTNLVEYKYTCETNPADPTGPGLVSAPIRISYAKVVNRWLMPIPQPEIDANPNLVQNPGY
jgi:starch-binding outer membrane protein, SusD/RagB family